MQLILRKWITQSDDESDNQKRVVTEKGLDFLAKWVEIQNMVGTKNTHKLMLYAPKIQPMRVQSNKLTI